MAPLLLCLPHCLLLTFLYVLTFFLLSCAHDSVTLNISSLSSIGLRADYVCYHTQGQVTEIIPPPSLPPTAATTTTTAKWADSFFRQIYYQMVQLKDAAWLYILFMMKWIFWLWLLLQDLHPPPPPSPSRNKVKHKPCPPHFSWMPSRSSPYLKEPLSKLELCQYISSMVRRSFQNK